MLGEGHHRPLVAQDKVQHRAEEGPVGHPALDVVQAAAVSATKRDSSWSSAATKAIAFSATASASSPVSFGGTEIWRRGVYGLKGSIRGSVSEPSGAVIGICPISK